MQKNQTDPSSSSSSAFPSYQPPQPQHNGLFVNGNGGIGGAFVPTNGGNHGSGPGFVGIPNHNNNSSNNNSINNFNINGNNGNNTNFSTMNNMSMMMSNSGYYGGNHSSPNNFYSSSGYHNGVSSTTSLSNMNNNLSTTTTTTNNNNNSSNNLRNNLNNLSNSNLSSQNLNNLSNTNLSNSLSQQRRGSGNIGNIMVQKHQQQMRTGGGSSRTDLLSKSVGAPSFLLTRMSSRGNLQDGESTTTIRHAGYLHKRSNLPYVASSIHGTDTPSSLAPLPDMSNTVIPLPIFDADTTSCENANVVDGNGTDVGVGGFQNAVDGSYNLVNNEPPPMYSLEGGPVNSMYGAHDDVGATMKEGTNDGENKLNDNSCFCSPLVNFFGNFLGKKSSPDAVAFKAEHSDETKDFAYENDRYGSTDSSTLPLTISQPHSPNILPYQTQNGIGGGSASINYNIPLKAPATEPVPISSGRHTSTQPQRIGNAGPGPVSEGEGNIIRASMTTNTSNTNSNYSTIPTDKTVKQYPVPPEDYIDPKDGHIWRAKYCVLEDGILYFYRTAQEGESDEAQAERNESRMMQSAQPEDSPRSDGGAGRGMGYGGMASSPRASLVGVPIPNATLSSGGRMITGNDRRTSQKDFHDLSMSPMPRKKSDLFDFAASPFHKSASTISGGGAAGTGGAALLKHSSSTNTFHHDADILWEKRVALDCVGAVRSSELEYGNHAFELLAFGFDERITGDDQSDASTHTGGVGGSLNQQQEIVDRLILRAGSSDDMNTWLFEFHQALFSYMQQLMNSVKNGDTLGQRNKEGKLNHLAFRHRPDSPVLHGHNRRIPPGSKSGGASSLVKQSSSPITESIGGSLGTSLSHGHGRNALYRRLVRDNKAGNSYVSPVSTPGGTPGGGSSPVEQYTAKPLLPIITQPDPLKIKITPKDTAPREAACEVKLAPKKYVPPHLRRKAAGSALKPTGSKPPVDEREEQPTPILKPRTTFSTSSESLKSDEPIQRDGTPALESLEETMSESAASLTSSLLSRQIEDAVTSSESNVVRLGGCADPNAIGGSILDKHFIPRKASVVGKDQMEAFGGIGGGLFLKPRQQMDAALTIEGKITTDASKENTSLPPTTRTVLKWEVGAASECGIRNSNEDSYVAIASLDEFINSQEPSQSDKKESFMQSRQQGLYAIFDGHVGNHAARFSAEKFPGILVDEHIQGRTGPQLDTIEERVDDILRKAFTRLDREFCNLCMTDGRDWDSGSTALVALIVDDTVSLANLGDCRGVVCRLFSDKDANNDTDGWEVLTKDDDDRRHGGERNNERERLYWREITETHSPLFDEERTRIERANGWIITETEIPTGQLHRMDFFDPDVVDIVKRCFADRFRQHRSDPARQIQIARTCGDLAVSRAIGDRDFKAAYNIPKNIDVVDGIARSWEGPPVFIFPEDHSGRFQGDLVSNIPDIKSFKVGQEGVVDEFLLMACDGLWDVMDSDDAVRIAKDLLFEKKMSAKDGASRLAELATHLGSSDNITVILIRFYWEECND